jgi:hypothetical protein
MNEWALKNYMQRLANFTVAMAGWIYKDSWLTVTAPDLPAIRKKIFGIALTKMPSTEQMISAL